MNKRKPVTLEDPSLAHRLVRAEENRAETSTRPNYKLRRAAAATLAIAGVSVLGAGVRDVVSDARPFSGAPVTTDVISPGDTVGKIAAEYADEKRVDPRDVAADIYDNSPDLADGAQIGDEIVRPATADEQASANSQNQG